MRRSTWATAPCPADGQHTARDLPSGRRVAFVGMKVRTRYSGCESSANRVHAGFPIPRVPLPHSSPRMGVIGFFTAAGGHAPCGSFRRRRRRPNGREGSFATFGGADWADNGQIYFTNSARGLSRVSASGGAVTQVSSPDSASGVKEHDFPDVLPGSRQAFVMLWRGSLGSNRVGVVDLGSGAVTELAEGSYARYLAPGLIVIGASDGRLLVSHFDAGKNRLARDARADAGGRRGRDRRCGGVVRGRGQWHARLSAETRRPMSG